MAVCRLVDCSLLWATVIEPDPKDARLDPVAGAARSSAPFPSDQCLPGYPFEAASSELPFENQAKFAR